MLIVSAAVYFELPVFWQKYEAICLLEKFGMNYIYCMETKKELSPKKFFVLLGLALIFGIADYYLCDLAVYGLKVPIFCDMIFCMAMSFFAGPVWGALVVLFDHAFDLIVSHSFVIYQMYLLTAVLGCFVVWGFKTLFMKEDDSVLNTLGKLFLLALIMCVFMSVTGGIVSRIIANINNDYEYTYQTEFLELLFEGKIKSPLLDSIIVRLPVNLADRSITVFASWGVFSLIKKIQKSL